MVAGFLRNDLLYGSCHVLGDGTITWAIGGIVSSSKVAVGTYDIALYTGIDAREAHFIPTCVSFGNVVVKAQSEPINDNLVRIRTGIGDSLTDCDFELTILHVRTINQGEAAFTISPVVVPPDPPDVAQFDCPATVIVGDAVYLSGVLTVDKAFAGIVGQTEDCIGIVLQKPSPTTCLVTKDGLSGAIYVGLVPGVTYYLSDLVPGGITNIAPSAQGTKLQELGIAASATDLDIHIDPTSVLL